MKYNRQYNIVDNVHGTIQISYIEKDLISRPLFNRLHKVLQCGTVNLTYPTNQTKRFEHSLGVMHLSGKLFFHSICNSDDDTKDEFLCDYNNIIFKIIKKEILNKDKRLIHNKIFTNDFLAKISDKLRKDDINSFNEVVSFPSDNLYNRYMIPNCNKIYLNTYKVLLQAIRLAGALHDIGHLPYSHSSEEAISTLYRIIKAKKTNTNRETNFITIMERIFERKKPLHEIVSDIVSYRLYEDIENTMHNTETHDNFNLFLLAVYLFVIELFEDKLEGKIYSEQIEFKNQYPDLFKQNSLLQDLHHIIDGEIDSDRLDYVDRDTINTGKCIYKIDHEAIMNSMKIIKFSFDINDNNLLPSHHYYFCPNVASVDALNAFFRKRWNIFESINFHHRCVKTERLLVNSIINSSIMYLKDEKEEDETCLLPKDISGLWRIFESIIDSASIKDLNNILIQWDDSWLDTCLKDTYISESYKSSEKIPVLYSQIFELISNRKEYSSIIKNKADYVEIDITFTEEFEKLIPQIDDRINQIKDGDILGDLEDSFSSFKHQFNDVKSENGFTLNCILFRLLFLFCVTLDMSKERKKLNLKCEKEIKENLIKFSKGKEVYIDDVMVKFIDISNGLNKTFDYPLLMYSNEKVYEYSSVSSLKEQLELSKFSGIGFYIYIRKINIHDRNDDKYYDRYIDYKSLFKVVGKSLANTMIQYIKDYVDMFTQV